MVVLDRAGRILVVVLLVAAAWSRSNARPHRIEVWKELYPGSTLPDRMRRRSGSECNVCHLPPDRGVLGTTYLYDLHYFMHQPMTLPEILRALEEVDSDGDGVPNGEEILAPRADGDGVGYHPGLMGDTGVAICSDPGGLPVTGMAESPPVDRVLEVLPHFVYLGDVPLGEVATSAFAVRNLAPHDVLVNSIHTELNITDAFSVTARDSFLLGPGEEEVLRVGFVARESMGALPITAAVRIESDSESPPVVARLQANIVVAMLALNVRQVDFGRVGVGERVERTILLRSPGSMRVIISAIRMGEGTSPAFAISRSLPPGFPIEPGDSQVIAVTYSPGAEGEDEGVLEILSNDYDEKTIRVPLSGAAATPFLRGDVDGDGKRSLGDVIHLLLCLFGRTACRCPDAGDVDDDGGETLGDAILALQVLFGSVTATPEPAEACGLDPTEDGLRCPEAPAWCGGGRPGSGGAG